jgi:putative transposase
MITSTLKLRLNKRQESTLDGWLWNLTSVYNWGLRKIELNAQNNIYFSKFAFVNLLADHGKKLDIPSHTIQGVLSQVYTAWQRCFKKIGGKPRLKGVRNKLNSISFPDRIYPPKENHISIPGIGKVRYHKQEIPKGTIKNGRIIKRASGWYLCLFIDSQREPIVCTGNGQVGIDPGFKSLLTLSTGEKIEHPRELEKASKRLAQAQRGHDLALASRIQERIANQKKDRNHKLSLRLVKENKLIAFSKDNIKGIAKKFGKSVSSSGHYQLRQMISYKSSSCGRKYVEPDSRNSTRMCATCKALTGPTGLSQLSVRHWDCACGAHNDRDVNSAVNVLNAGAGAAHEKGLRHVA